MATELKRCPCASLIRTALSAVAVAFLLGICAVRGDAPESLPLRLPVRFAVIGDRTGGHQPGIHGKIVGEIDRMNPDFVVGVGDMIEGYTGDTTAIKTEWKEYAALIRPLDVPFYMVPGNHDIWDSASAEFYRRYAGQPYYSFDTGPLPFIVLDTSRWSTVSTFPQEQITWLMSDLERSREAEYTIVIYHIPYWIETIAKGNPDPLHDVFVDYGVDAVFTGHYHVYFGGEYDGILYTGVGSSGGHCEPGVTGLMYHFMWVTVTRHGLSIAPVRMGSVLPWEEVTAETFNLVRDIRQEAVRIGKIRSGTAASLGETDAVVTVRNFSGDSTLTAMLEWDVPTAWSVRPKRLPVEVAPGESLKVSFKAATHGPLYPAPTLAMAYPFDTTYVDVEAYLGLTRTVYARRADQPPRIDGQLDEPLWMGPVDDLYTGEGFLRKADSTGFFFAWDQANLYVGAVCMEAEPDSMVAAVTGRDGAVYGEDCVGFFLQPNVPDGPVYQIYFNPLGTVFDQKIAVREGRYTDVDRQWDGTYEVAVTKGRDRWSIEARIPLAQLETQGQYEKTWAVNFRRKQKRLDTSADWQIPIGYDPADYGYLIMQ